MKDSSSWVIKGLLAVIVAPALAGIFAAPFVEDPLRRNARSGQDPGANLQAASAAERFDVLPALSHDPPAPNDPPPVIGQIKNWHDVQAFGEQHPAYKACFTKITGASWDEVGEAVQYENKHGLDSLVAAEPAGWSFTNSTGGAKNPDGCRPLPGSVLAEPHNVLLNVHGVPRVKQNCGNPVRAAVPKAPKRTPEITPAPSHPPRTPQPTPRPTPPPSGKQEERSSNRNPRLSPRPGDNVQPPPDARPSTPQPDMPQPSAGGGGSSGGTGSGTSPPPNRSPSSPPQGEPPDA